MEICCPPYLWSYTSDRWPISTYCPFNCTSCKSDDLLLGLLTSLVFVYTTLNWTFHVYSQASSSPRLLKRYSCNFSWMLMSSACSKLLTNMSTFSRFNIRIINIISFNLLACQHLLFRTEQNYPWLVEMLVVSGVFGHNNTFVKYFKCCLYLTGPFDKFGPYHFQWPITLLEC